MIASPPGHLRRANPPPILPNGRRAAVAAAVLLPADSLWSDNRALRPPRKEADRMRLRRQRPAPAPPPAETTKPIKPAWQELLDPQERPNREDLAAQHDVFTDSILEP